MCPHTIACCYNENFVYSESLDIYIINYNIFSLHWLHSFIHWVIDIRHCNFVKLFSNRETGSQKNNLIIRQCVILRSLIIVY